MERRRFWALVARAQATVPRVGVMHTGGPYRAVVEGFREGLEQVGLEATLPDREADHVIQ
jgi:hypothetical protein